MKSLPGALALNLLAWCLPGAVRSGLDPILKNLLENGRSKERLFFYRTAKNELLPSYTNPEGL